MADIVALRKSVSAHELSRYVAVLVLFLFVFTLDGDVSVVCLDGDLFRGKLLHVDDNLELVLTPLDHLRCATHLMLEFVHHVLPWSEAFSEGRNWWHFPYTVSGVQTFEMFLKFAVITIHVLPPITEKIPRYQRHFARCSISYG